MYHCSFPALGKAAAPAAFLQLLFPKFLALFLFLFFSTSCQPLHVKLDTEAVLFEDKHSVVPSVMNSHEWQDKFVWLQKVVLEHGRFAGALKVAVRHFNFVRPRWESTACPRRRMAHLIVPTALVLALTAADQRTDSCTKRRRVQLSVSLLSGESRSCVL